MEQKKGLRQSRIWLLVLAGAAALAAGIFLLTRSFPAQPADWDPDAVYLLVKADFDPDSPEELLAAYSDYRADSLRQTKTMTIPGAQLLDGTDSLPRGFQAVRLTELFSPEVITEEERRQGLISEMEWLMQRRITDSTWQNTIVSQQNSGTLIYLKCDIHIQYDYLSAFDGEDNGNAMQDEFVTQHTITLQKGENGYRLIADAYIEEPTGMRSSTYMDTTH